MPPRDAIMADWAERGVSRRVRGRGKGVKGEEGRMTRRIRARGEIRERVQRRIK